MSMGRTNEQGDVAPLISSPLIPSSLPNSAGMDSRNIAHSHGHYSRLMPTKGFEERPVNNYSKNLPSIPRRVDPSLGNNGARRSLFHTARVSNPSATGPTDRMTSSLSAPTNHYSTNRKLEVRRPATTSTIPPNKLPIPMNGAPISNPTRRRSVPLPPHHYDTPLSGDRGSIGTPYRTGDVMNVSSEKRRVKVMTKQVRQELIEKEYRVQEREQITGEVMEDLCTPVREITIEKLKQRIKTVEVPEIEYIEKVYEVPETRWVEREVPRNVYKELGRIIEVPVVRTVEKIELYHVVENVDVEHVKEVPVIVEEIVEKEVEVKVPQYVDVPVEEVVDVVEYMEVPLNFPIPIRTDIFITMTMPRLVPKYTTLETPFYYPRFIEVPVPMDLLDDETIDLCSSILSRVEAIQTAMGEETLRSAAMDMERRYPMRCSREMVPDVGLITTIDENDPWSESSESEVDDDRDENEIRSSCPSVLPPEERLYVRERGADMEI